MSRPQQKEDERRFLEQFRDLAPGFPAGEIVDSEPPYFLIKTPAGIIGFDVTEIYLPTALTLGQCKLRNRGSKRLSSGQRPVTIKTAITPV